MQKIDKDNIEYFCIETTPHKTYSSRPRRGPSGSLIYFTGSQGNLEEVLDNTGSIYLYTMRSPSEKETVPYAVFGASPFMDSSFELLRRGVLENTSSNNVKSAIETYLSAVYETTASLRKQQKLEIIRFVPTFNFSSNTLRKTITTDHLMPYYKSVYPTSDFSFSNFHCLHFFSDPPLTGALYPIPSQSVLLYPNPRGTQISSGVFDSPYGHREGMPFTFDFWINPKYSINEEGDEYNAGCILHLSSAYAISIHSGSSKDINGKPNKFRLMLQFGSGSGLPPSTDVESAISGVFLSTDNVLEFNKWQHVTIKYGGTAYNNGSGSFVINGNNAGNFSFNSPGFGLYDTNQNLSPDVLCIGNFYEGENYLAEFFNANSALRDGLEQLTSGTADPDPDAYSFSHPLNAEIHDLKIYNKFLTSTEIETLDTAAPQNLDNLKFYLPPFFTEESPFRQFVGEWGGVPITPFQERDGTSTTPFGANMAFSVGGHYMNLENFVRDFATGTYPRLWFLTGSSFEPGNTALATANAFLYSSGTNAGAVKKRLYTALPCDHGNWQPNFNLLQNMSGSRTGGHYRDSSGRYNPGIVSLRNIVSGVSDLVTKGLVTSGTIIDDVLGARPENMSASLGSGLTMLHRLKDPSSNQVVLFDVSNLFYGLQIKPGTIILTDPYPSGSGRKFDMTVKDDGLGNLYRADCSGSFATWSSVGNIFYNEGILMLKAPQYFFFGKQGFDIEFRGIQNVHVMSINTYAKSMQLISSSNPNYEQLDYDTDLANEPDQRYVNITGVNIHNEDLNVIARAKLAQPLIKKSGDKYLIKVRWDW